MTKVLVEETNLSNIANAIREKTNTTDTFKPSEMSEAIYSITSSNEDLSTELTTQDTLLNTQETSIEDIIEALEGKTVATPVLQAKSVIPTTSNQEVTPDSGYDGLSAVTVSAVTSAIDSDIIAGNIKKGVNILGVTGTLEEGITPTGTKEITVNGTYDVTNYASANVNVPTGGGEVPEKGLVIHEYDSDGYITSASVVGLTEIPKYMFYGTFYRGSSTAVSILGKCTNFSLPNGLTAIRTSAFQGCDNLPITELPSTLEVIEDHAFYGCTNLPLTSLPDEVYQIGSNAFYNCKNLALTSLPRRLGTITDKSFYNCTNLALTSLPNITNIQSYAFQNCTNLPLTSLPDSLTQIGSYAFQNCTNLPLTSLSNGLTSLSTYAFSGCTNLKLKSVPSGIKRIYSYTFQNCTSITEMTLEGEVTYIEANAFKGCSSLAKLVLPNITKLCTLASSTSLSGTPIADKTGSVYVPDTLVDTFKSASNWSALDIKGISELPA